MSGDERNIAEEMLALCVKAKEKGVTLFLYNNQYQTNMSCCSSSDATVIAAIASAEVSNLSTVS